MAELIERRGQLSLFSGTHEAAAFHTRTRGFFSVNWRNAQTKAAAEEVQLLLRDIKAYEEGDFRLAHAMRSDPGVASVDERVEKLRGMVAGRSPMAVKQRCYPLSELPAVLDALTRSAHFAKTDYWISQHGFSQPNRRATCVQSINLLFCDLDVRSMGHDLQHHDPVEGARIVARMIEDAGIPLPSFILWSGNGFHCKWLLYSPLPRSAKPIWDAMQLHLVNKLAAAGLPVDLQVRDVSRILRVAGTFNQKGGELVRVVWIHGTCLQDCYRHDFNELADSKSIMPWSRAEAREKKALGKIWDANRAIQRTIADLCKPDESVRRFIAADVWHSRLSAIRRLVEIRHGGAGLPDGKRNELTWLAANALAWSAGSADDYFRDLLPVVREIAPTMTNAEVLSSASAVSKRIKQEAGHGQGLYRMTNATFNAKLGLTDSEAAELFSESAKDRSSWDVGVMGFEKMHNLPYEQYKAETKRRQAEAGRRSAQVRKSRHGADLREKARQMREQGMKLTQIAAELCVSVGSVHSWTK